MSLSCNLAPVRRNRVALERESFNLAVALRDRKADVVRFATDLRVPFTDNRAGSDVRMVKLHAKISGPSRAMHGAERFAAVRSYLQTAAKHDLRPIEVLTAPARPGSPSGFERSSAILGRSNPNESERSTASSPC